MTLPVTSNPRNASSGMPEQAKQTSQKEASQTMATPPQMSSSQSLGRVPLQPGEIAEPEEHERPLSAPPPPGFHGGYEERNRIATSMLWGQNATFAYPRPIAGDDSYGSGSTNSQHRDRSSSFSNMAAMLGAGLIQSLDGEHVDGYGLWNNKTKLAEDLNAHRQSRHAASRMLGAGGEGSNKQTPPFSVASSGNGDGNYGVGAFPSVLTPPRESQERHRGSTTPVQMYPGQRNMPASRDVGTKVSEPGDSRSDPRDLQSMWAATDAPEFRPANQGLDMQSTQSSLSDTLDTGATELSAKQAEAELKPFLWDMSRQRPSRTLAILHVSYLRVPDVRSACEAFGAIESFRSEFSSRGIFFINFYDIRSAQYAALELQQNLQRMCVVQGSSEEVLVRYCLPLDSSSQFDDSQLVLNDVPEEVSEQALNAMLSSYGAIRTVIAQGYGSFAIEFQSLQDTKQAKLEIEIAQPYGPNVMVEVGVRSASDRARGRELLALISRWRSVMNRGAKGNAQPAGMSDAVRPAPTHNQWQPSSQSVHSQVSGFGSAASQGSFGGGFNGSQHSNRPQEMPVLGPNGQYIPVSMPGSFNQFGGQQQQQFAQVQPQQQFQQQLVQGPNGQLYLTAVPVAHSGHIYVQPHRPGSMHGGGAAYSTPTIITNPAFVDGGRDRSSPYLVVATDATSVSGVSAYSGRSHRSGASTHDGDNRHLQMDLDNVESGRDTRTSLMVRNIPNKYTQQMLLSEFMENGHGPGVIDFFYLPIDFKNRCNRGYAFINFVDYKDILPFHQRYFGKHWRTFNSDKICDITYARIQGKAAMLKRFENSALMEKDEEYKPLVFVSDGPDKGKRLPFPDPATRS